MPSKPLLLKKIYPVHVFTVSGAKPLLLYPFVAGQLEVPVLSSV